jgi:hypothetical protein
MYTTGVLHDKKKPNDEKKEALKSPLQTREDVFASMSTEGNRHIVNAQWLSDFFNERYKKFGGDLRAAGIPARKMFAHLLSMMEVESNLEVGKGNKVARGLLQFEWPTWRSNLTAVDNLPPELAQFLERVQREDTQRLGRGALWKSLSPEDSVVQTEEHITMALHWLNFLMSEQPSPIELEYNRLDGVFLQKVGSEEKDGLSGREMTTIPLRESWANLKEKYAQDDPQRMLLLLLAAEWNQGRNISNEQIEQLYSYIKSGAEEKKAFQQKAASDVKKFVTARGVAVKRIGALRRDVMSDQLKRQLISVDPKVRLNALLTMAAKLANREKERTEFIAAWKAFRNAETGLAEASWRMGPCVRGAAYALKSIAIWEDADEAYQLGLGYRNVYNSTKQAKSVVDKAKRDQFKSLFQGRPGPAPRTQKFSPVRPRSPQKTLDRAMTPYGGIDLQTDQMDLSILGNAGAFAVEIPTVQFEQLKQDVRGFVPLIINIEPLQNVPAFLGMAESNERRSG